MSRVAARSAPLADVARVVVVDDHELARAGLASLLHGERDIEIVGQASGGRRAVALCRRLKPDLVLMDIRMADMDGLDATRSIKRSCPTTSVIIITILDQADYLFEALRAGASGYLLKDAAKDEILTTMRQVRRGNLSIPNDLAAHLLPRMAAGVPATFTCVPEHLSPRERDVLRFLVRGYSNPEIARALDVSLSTVKTHIEHIHSKLRVSDRTQAAVKAIEMGLLADGIRGQEGRHRERRKRTSTTRAECQADSAPG